MKDEQKHIADFWDDNPFKINVIGHVMFGTKNFLLPGHWMSIAESPLVQKANSILLLLLCLCENGNAQFDAFIHCWDEKYQEQYGRPETVINKYFDQNWKPHLQTPPFPEYLPAGIPPFRLPAAEALTHVFGENFPYTDTT